jgi:hypothetical protein
MRSLRHQQSLGVGVESNELNTRHAGLNHAVHRIAAAASDADNADLRKAFNRVISH